MNQIMHNFNFTLQIVFVAFYKEMLNQRKACDYFSY